MALQRIRTTEVRKPDVFDDQKTPAEIDASETTSADFEDLTNFILSQIRQILGTANWHDAVPLSLSDINFIPTAAGDVLLSLDGLTFESVTPLIGDGWLVNEGGELLIV